MPQRFTTKEFIKRAIKVHGKKFDYSEVKYINAHTKITIICPDHGKFSQSPNKHLRSSHGCNLCGYKFGSEKQKINIHTFIKRASEIHDNFYDYSLSKYVNSRNKVIVNCPIHGSFKVSPSNHLKKIRPRGCPECGRLKSAKSNTFSQEYFLNLSKKVHKNFYDYSKAKYKGINTSLTIICPEHGEFKQIARTHLLGSGCKKCGINKVANSKRLSTLNFIEMAKKIHGEIYDYSKSQYGKNNLQKVIIICPKHGEFNQAPTKHLSGSGCSKCQNKGEGRIASYLLDLTIIFREFSLKNKRYDFFLPDFNLLIERDGQQHYKNTQIKHEVIKVKDQQKNDLLKTKLAKKEGYKIARIPYWLTEDEEKIEIDNILKGKPTYPDVPDLKQEKTKPRPKIN